MQVTTFHHILPGFAFLHYHITTLHTTLHQKDFREGCLEGNAIEKPSTDEVAATEEGASDTDEAIVEEATHAGVV